MAWQGLQDEHVLETVVDITPWDPQDDTAEDTDPRWLGPLLVLGLPIAVVAVFAGLFRYLLLPAPQFPQSDTRACAGSIEPLESVASRLGVRVPDGAQQVRYLTAGIGDGPELQLAFRVPTSTLDAAMRANSLAVARPQPLQRDRWAAAGGLCGGSAGGGVTFWTGSRSSVRAEVIRSDTMPTVQVLLQVDG